jgi:hypothetical protein
MIFLPLSSRHPDSITVDVIIDRAITSVKIFFLFFIIFASTSMRKDMTKALFKYDSYFSPS